MPARARSYEYVYESDPKDARSAEFKFVKYFLALMLIVYLLSSIWIFFFIFEQADWERNANMADARAWTAVTAWTWWTVISVISADIFAILFFYLVIWQERAPPLLALAVLAYCFSIYALASRYLRGSIVCFVFPFVCATLALIQFFMQRHEDEEHEITKGLKLNETKAMKRYDYQ